MRHIRFTQLLKCLTLLIVTVWQISVKYIINICFPPVDSQANCSHTFKFDDVGHLYKYMLRKFFFHIVSSLNFFLHFYLTSVQKPTILTDGLYQFLKRQTYFSVQPKRLSAILRCSQKAPVEQSFTNTYISKQLRYSTAKILNLKSIVYDKLPER